MASEVRALTGIRIIDFSAVLAGPFATQQLAQLGADVIKIEQPGTGDMTRGLMASTSDGMAPSFLTCNLGKRSITIDLKHTSAKTIVYELVKTADVVVENFKPGTIDRLGFGYESLKAINPNLIYASISGYGQSGPKSELPAFDGAIQASSGMMSISGHNETGPTRAGYFAVDMSTSLNAAFAITAALLRRNVTGEGQRVDISMMDSAVMMQAPQFGNYFLTKNLPDLTGNHSPTKQPTANVFATSDGFVQIIALKESHVQELFELVGQGQSYARFPDPEVRLKNATEIEELLEPAIKRHDTEFWLDSLGQSGIPSAPIRSLSQVAEDSQFDHRLTFTEIEKPGSPENKLRVVSASHLTHPAPPSVQREPPQLGQHTVEILDELGFSKEDIRSFQDQKIV